MTVYCIRGATTVAQNKKEDILQETKLLISEVFRVNHVDRSQIVSIFFSTTADLDAVYPAAAVRTMGYHEVALMCFQEMNVANSLEKCIRVGVFVEKPNPNRNSFSPTPVYLKKAKTLRPDLEEMEDDNGYISSGD